MGGVGETEETVMTANIRHHLYILPEYKLNTLIWSENM